jgi:hypothetical protein
MDRTFRCHEASMAHHLAQDEGEVYASRMSPVDTELSGHAGGQFAARLRVAPDVVGHVTASWYGRHTFYAIL